MASDESAAYSFTVRGWPVLSNAQVTGIASNGGNLWVDTDTASGMLFWVADTATADPTPEMIVAGLNGEGDPATTSGSYAVGTTGQQGPFVLIPFLPNSNVGFWIVQRAQDGVNFSNTELGRFTTTDSGEIDPPGPEIPPETTPPEYTTLTSFYTAERPVPGVTPQELAGLPAGDFDYENT